MKNKYILQIFGILILAFLSFHCQKEAGSADTDNYSEQEAVFEKLSGTLFSKLGSLETGVKFNNKIVETGDINYYTSQYMYNGGGVSIGDIDNDGLPDLFFTGNMVKNKLYLNKGDLNFEDISAAAGIEADEWCSGTNMVDVNNDGYLDIYICRGGTHVKDAEKRENLLFVNNGPYPLEGGSRGVTFTERAKEYGINESGYSVHSAFFDFDLDGDLDLYVTNHPRPASHTITDAEMAEIAKNPSDAERDKLYKNNGNGTFTEVSKELGINNYGFGLGLGIGDLNSDGYPDIYVGNDFVTSDNCYLNAGPNGFKDVVFQAFRHSCEFSMGLDIADCNNDGLLDILVLDMNPEDNYRQKTNMASMNPDKFWSRIQLGYHPQYMRNMLQLNNGEAIFSDIGQMAGLPNTDWSWSPLFVDLNNDGWQDVFVSNGYFRDVLDKDYQKEVKKYKTYKTVSWENLSENLKSTKINNYVFRNNRDLTFSKINEEWGLNDVGFSNGAAYADLDLDGDLEIIVSNINDEATILRNNARELGNNQFLQVKLQGNPENPEGLGTKITLKTAYGEQYREYYVSRGFQSSMDHIVHFGIAAGDEVKELHVRWYDGKEQKLNDVKINDRIIVRYADASELVGEDVTASSKTIFRNVTRELGTLHKHQENAFDDYESQVLLPHKMSQFGPNFAVGDANGDGLEDFYVGGPGRQFGVLYFQNNDGTVTPYYEDAPWKDDALSEDLGCLFFDADNDEDLDLYVVSGGNEYQIRSPLLQDRLYLNNGSGEFSHSTSLPTIRSSGSCVIAADYDKDGDQDLFVGGRMVPHQYLNPPESFILKNENGRFMDVTDEVAPGLKNIGMVTSAVWTDFDQDDNLDLVVVGEWMPITVFSFDGNKFSNKTVEMGLENTGGWWNKIVEADMDNDGDPDYVLGNLGLNYKYKASEKEPFKVYCSDFDGNGFWDIVLGFYEDGTEYPLRGRQCSSEQLPFIEEKFPTYASFASSDIEDVYGEDLEDAIKGEVRLFKSVYIENQNGQFNIKPLPNRAQISPVFGIIIEDFTADGNPDILMAGNFFVSEVETGMADAGVGLLLRGNGKGDFEPVRPAEAGFFARLDVRDIALVSTKTSKKMVLVGNNNNYMQVFSCK